MDLAILGLLLRSVASKERAARPEENGLLRLPTEFADLAPVRRVDVKANVAVGSGLGFCILGLLFIRRYDVWPSEHAAWLEILELLLIVEDVDPAITHALVRVREGERFVEPPFDLLAVAPVFLREVAVAYEL